MKREKRTFHYAWWILIMCCALQAGSQGTIFDTCGLFTHPVCSELGFEVGRFTVAQTIGAIAMMAAQPFTTGAYRKFGMRPMLLVSGVLYYASHFCMGLSSQVWHWYILMAVQGIAGGFFYRVSYTMLICQWFASKTATALGIATAVGSVMGMAMNPVAAHIMETLGWRSCYMILAGTGALLTLPIIAVVLRRKKIQECSPYRAAGSLVEKKSFTGRHRGKRAHGVSLLLILAAGVSYFCGGYYPHLSNYCVTIGMGLTAGSLMTSFELGGTTVIKFVIGSVLEKLGFLKTVILLAVLSVIGYAGYFFLSGSALYFTTALCGIYCSTTAMVLLPLFAREQVGEERFERILPWMTTIGGAVSSMSNTLYGYLFDASGNYFGMFGICIAAILVSVAAIAIICTIKPENEQNKNLV